MGVPLPPSLPDGLGPLTRLGRTGPPSHDEDIAPGADLLPPLCWAGVQQSAASWARSASTDEPPGSVVSGNGARSHACRPTVAVNTTDGRGVPHASARRPRDDRSRDIAA